MRGRFQPIKTLSSRLFRKNKGRNVVAVLAILMTTLMFTTLFTLAQSMSKNMVEMTFRQTGYDAQASFKSITGEEAALIGAHPDVREVGESIVLGVAENRELKGYQTEIRWGDDFTPPTPLPGPLPAGCRRQKTSWRWTPPCWITWEFPMSWGSR